MAIMPSYGSFFYRETKVDLQIVPRPVAVGLVADMVDVRSLKLGD